jgi:hypothetical protein
VYVLLGAMFVSVDLSTVSFAQHFGHKPLAGFILGTYALGSATGGLWYGSRQWRAPAETRFAVTLTLTVLGVATFWAQPNLVTLTCVIYLCGLTIAPTLIAGFSLLEEQAKPGRRTEAMSWLSSGIAVGVAGGASVVGFILDAHGPRVGYAFAAACGAASAVTCLLGLRRLRVPAERLVLPRSSSCVQPGGCERAADRVLPAGRGAGFPAGYPGQPEQAEQVVFGEIGGQRTVRVRVTHQVPAERGRVLADPQKRDRTGVAPQDRVVERGILPLQRDHAVHERLETPPGRVERRHGGRQALQPAARHVGDDRIDEALPGPEPVVQGPDAHARGSRDLLKRGIKSLGQEDVQRGSTQLGDVVPRVAPQGLRFGHVCPVTS